MSENKQTTDSELLLQIVGYNSEAFEQLYNRYSATVYSLIKEIITNPKLAEKILLNVFSVFLKRIDYYCTTSNDVYTWLTLLTRNISIDALKRMKFVEDIPIYSDDYEIESILPNLSQVITPINLEDRAILGEKIKLYKSHLTEVQNLVLSLVYFEGLNEEEIAKRLSVPVVTVRQKVLSIMESLHHQYTGHTEDVKINKEVLSLIKLEALGCLSSEERILFNEIRKNDPDFLWKELGEYQNLTALLATPIPLQNPGHELNGEIKEVFTKILQGSEVDYPIIAPEPPLMNQFQEPIPELIQQQIQNQISEVIKQPEIQETKKTGFELKFRERDPKELSILKKIETVESKPQPTPVVAKKETEIQFRNYKTADKKPVGFNDRKNSSTEVREAISAVIKNEVSIQNKTSSFTTEKPNLQIENDDPSIVIEEPKQTEVKENITVKNRLIPNSSINLKEFFKKDQSTIVSKEMVPVKTVEEKKVIEIPLEPVVQKPDIIIKSNEPPKEFRKSSVFVDKNENIIQSKPITPVVQKPLVENKINGPVKENQKLNTEVVKEEKTVIEKPLEPVVQKPDIVIKTNEPPKEFRKSSVFVDKNENIIQSKPITPVVQKSLVENKTNAPVKENQKLNTEVVKEEKTVIEKPLEPVVQKPDIVIKTNEPPKEFRKSSVFVDKNENIIQSKPITPVIQKPLVENKINGPVKENQKLNTEIVKEEMTVIEKPLEPVVQKPDIVIKTNEPPKEFRSSVFVDKNENTNQSKPIIPVIQKPSVENKTNEQVKKIQKSTIEVAQEEKKALENPIVPVVQKPDIIIKANEPPKEFIRKSTLVDKNENLTQSKPTGSSVQKTSVENKTNEPVKETQKSNTDIIKEEEPIEIKSQQAATNHDIKTSIQSINQKEKNNSAIKKDEKLFERINPSADRSNLKIRETVFAENEKKTEILQQETSTAKSDSNSKTEEIDPPVNLKKAINIDEILSNIEDEKPAPVVLSESESYQKEIVRLRKKIKRNILVSAAVFAILASTSVFVYLQFQEAPRKVVDKITPTEKIILTEQTNPIITKETTPEISTETPVLTSTSVISEQPVTNKKVMTPPLPEFSTKEESTLFAAKVNNNSLSSNDDKQTIQTAAAKTEPIIPPKEIKKVEEEPAFFVAVEEMPELIGGIKGLQSKIVYPEIAKRVGIEGKVIVQAIVDETGKVISVNTLKGIGSGCDEVAMDAVLNSQFIPGKQRGKTVKTQVTIPIVFKK